MLDRVLRYEMTQQLPQHQLMRLDKLTMAHGVEARVPFLDVDLVAYVSALPSAYKVRGFREKRLLKHAMSGPSARRRHRSAQARSQHARPPALPQRVRRDLPRGAPGRAGDAEPVLLGPGRGPALRTDRTRGALDPRAEALPDLPLPQVAPALHRRGPAGGSGRASRRGLAGSIGARLRDPGRARAEPAERALRKELWRPLRRGAAAEGRGGPGAAVARSAPARHDPGVTRALAACALALLFATPARAEGARIARSELRGSGEAGARLLPARPGNGGGRGRRRRALLRSHPARRGGRDRVPAAAGDGHVGDLPALLRPPGTSLSRARRLAPRRLPDLRARGAAAGRARARACAGAPGAREHASSSPGSERARRGPKPTLSGTVVKSAPGAIEVELDAPADLRGWGGAPVLLADGEKVIGLLQAAWPSGHLTRTSVGPIAGVADAMAEPFENGLGRLFATLAPQASAANSSLQRRQAAAGTPEGDLSPDTTAGRLDAALAAAPAPSRGAPGAVQLTIDSPEPEAIFGDAAGAFLAGSALAQQVRNRDASTCSSSSTRRSRRISRAESTSTGTASSASRGPRPTSGAPIRATPILGAEVAAAEKVVDGLDPKRTRVGVVTFAGEALLRFPGDLERPPVRRAALHPGAADFRLPARSRCPRRAGAQRALRDDAHGGRHRSRHPRAPRSGRLGRQP